MSRVLNKRAFKESEWERQTPSMFDDISKVAVRDANAFALIRTAFLMIGTSNGSY